MNCIIGLGNPGRKYALTRHNAGFMAVDSLARHWNIDFKKKIRLKSRVAQHKFGNEKIFLIKPQTFMNLSGQAVKAVMKSKGLKPHDLLVVVDDKDLALGQLRLRQRGSSGGHNGLKSIIESLQTEDFPRVRIGVRGERFKEDTAEYVLKNFMVKETKVVSEVIERFIEMVHCLKLEGMSKAMSLYNKKV